MICKSLVSDITVTANGKFLKAAGFSACEFERSKNEQVEKTADAQEHVCTPLERGAHGESFFLLANMQIYLEVQAVCALKISRGCESLTGVLSACAFRSAAKPVSKWQAGCERAQQ